MEEKALVTLKAMIEARGLKVGDPEPLASVLDETSMYKIGDVLIIFSDKSRINEANLSSYIKYSSENGYTNGTIIVSLIPCSEKIVNIVRSYISKKENPLLQIFDILRLQTDISKHRKFIPHRILKQQEISLFEKKFNVTKPSEQLGWIDSQDAAAKWIGARPGDIIEVIRFSESAGDARSWRYCVANTKE
uniref:RNA polymerase subunit H/Rpb5 C-terminal domain-containing protein n=1 Tax=viral metagenome TaxID=1070528 RepID=A0A6C0HFI0_9ZZZZ